jgi:uridine kinase
MACCWTSFDFTAAPLEDGSYANASAVINYLPNDIIILEEAYSCRPKLSDLFHLKILVDVPVQLRHDRLQKREGNEFLIHWHDRWDDAEVYYFSEKCPKASFDTTRVYHLFKGNLSRYYYP